MVRLDIEMDGLHVLVKALHWSSYSQSLLFYMAVADLRCSQRPTCEDQSTEFSRGLLMEHNGSEIVRAGVSRGRRFVRQVGTFHALNVAESCLQFGEGALVVPSPNPRTLLLKKHMNWRRDIVEV